MHATPQVIPSTDSVAEVTLDSSSGTNYWNNDLRSMTFLVKGTEDVSYRTLDTVMASATLETTVAEFFDGAW